MNFNESDNVVCVDDTPFPTNPNDPLGAYTFPCGMIKKGAVYVVESVQVFPKSIGLHIVGKPVIENVKDKGLCAVGWSSNRFRLLKTLSALAQHSTNAGQGDLSKTALKTSMCPKKTIEMGYGGLRHR